MIEQLLEVGEFQEALEHLNDFNDEFVRYQRLVCLYGLKQLEQARIEGLSAKNKAKETYFDVVSIYLSILKDLQEFEEAINIVIEELSMPYIPYQYESLFNAAYDELLLEKQNLNSLNDNKSLIFNDDEIERTLLEYQNEDLLYMVIDQLQGLNIRTYLYPIRVFLKNDNAPSLAKALLFDMLIEQQVDEDFEIKKNDEIHWVNPIYQSKIDESVRYIEIGDILVDHLESENPSLLLVCLEYLNYLMYDLFPIEVYDDEFGAYGAAIHYYLATLQYIEIDLDGLAFEYGVQSDEILEKIEILKQITI